MQRPRNASSIIAGASAALFGGVSLSTAQLPKPPDRGSSDTGLSRSIYIGGANGPSISFGPLITGGPFFNPQALGALGMNLTIDVGDLDLDVNSVGISPLQMPQNSPLPGIVSPPNSHGHIFGEEQLVSKTARELTPGIDATRTALEIGRAAAGYRMIRFPSEESSRLFRFLDGLSSAAGKLATGVTAVARLEEKVERSRYLNENGDEIIKDAVSVTKRFKEIDQLVRMVRGIRVEEVNKDEFVVSPELLASNSQEAKRLLLAFQDALDNNVSYLEQSQEWLEEVNRRYLAGRESLDILQEALLKANNMGGGVLGDFLLLEWLDIEQLKTDLSGIYSPDKLKKIDELLKSEKLRLENLRGNLNDWFPD